MGIKRADGSVKWNEVKVNPAIEQTWGTSKIKLNTEPVKLDVTNGIKEIRKHVAMLIDDAIADTEYPFSTDEQSAAAWARVETLNEVLDFIDLGI